MPSIQVTPHATGLTYLIHASPAALPPVLLRDLAGAWDSARHAALAGTGSRQSRAFSFALPDGGVTNLALPDRDAQCWVQAVDRRLDLSSPYGLSVCLRLLALVDLLAHAPWAQDRMRLRGGAADLDAALLRLAAKAKLTDEAGFDAAIFRRDLAGPVARTSAA